MYIFFIWAFTHWEAGNLINFIEGKPISPLGVKKMSISELYNSKMLKK